MDQLSPLPFVVHVGGLDDPADVVDALALGSFVAGEQPWARTVELSRVRHDAALLPAGATVVRVAESPRSRRLVAVGDGWTLGIVRWSDATAHLSVTAVSEELARRVLEEAADGATEPEPAGRDGVTMSFWHLGSSGPVRKRRPVATPAWSAIRRNYTGPVAAAFDRLVALTPGTVAGRLLLLHGPPGTGKTTALRCLADAWRDWCGVECVLDPERFLRAPGYLIEVAMGVDTDDGDAGGRWRLVILEDCDELVRAGAKDGVGQNLSRLLNLTDGMLGHGLEVLVAITTNEPLANLHPAVVRPGRCLAEVEVGRLTRAEAARWLGTGAGIGPDGATLAELLAVRSGTTRIDGRAPRRVVGLYL